MNLSTLRTATTLARRAYGSYADYRDRKAVQAYEALVEAANKADVQGLIDESQRRFSTLSEKALDRIETARNELNVDKAVDKASEKIAGLAELGKAKTKKATKAQRKAAKKAAKKAERKVNAKFARRKRGRKLVKFTVITAIGTGVGAVAYYFFAPKRDQEEYGTEPPTVSDYEQQESVLVYSTETSGSPEEGVTERDEELLEALEEQLKNHDAE